MAEDFAPPKTKREMLALVASDKGNKIAVLQSQLDELEAALPGRLEERERLEKEISSLNEKTALLTANLLELEGKQWKADDKLAVDRKELDKIEGEKRTAEAAIRDLEEKREERNALAREIVELKQEELELQGSIRIKTIEVRGLEVKENSIREREHQLAGREEIAAANRKAAADMLGEAARKYDETATLQKQIEEDRRHIDLSGKSMGYYIRGIQRIFDERKLGIDFIKLLDEIK